MALWKENSSLRFDIDRHHACLKGAWENIHHRNKRKTSGLVQKLKCAWAGIWLHEKLKSSSPEKHESSFLERCSIWEAFLSATSKMNRDELTPNKARGWFRRTVFSFLTLFSSQFSITSLLWRSFTLIPSLKIIRSLCAPDVCGWPMVQRVPEDVCFLL